MNQPQYEFSAAQNTVVGKLASRMRWAGIMQIVFGALQLVGNCSVHSGDGSFKVTSTSSPVYLALIIAGALMIPAAGSFAKIVQTQGNDISHLMDALGKYSKTVFAQLISYVVLGALFVLVVLLIIVALTLLVSVFGEASGS